MNEKAEGAGHAHLGPPFIRIFTDGLTMGCAVIGNTRANIRSGPTGTGQTRSYGEGLNLRFMIGHQSVGHGDDDDRLVFVAEQREGELNQGGS